MQEQNFQETATAENENLQYLDLDLTHNLISQPPQQGDIDPNPERASIAQKISFGFLRDSIMKKEKDENQSPKGHLSISRTSAVFSTQTPPPQEKFSFAPKDPNPESDMSPTEKKSSGLSRISAVFNPIGNQPGEKFSFGNNGRDSKPAFGPSRNSINFTLGEENGNNLQKGSDTPNQLEKYTQSFVKVTNLYEKNFIQPLVGQNVKFDVDDYEVKLPNRNSDQQFAPLCPNSQSVIQKKNFVFRHSMQQSRYSNNYLYDIKKILKPAIIREFNYINDDQILYEGTLLKYKPGCSFNWVERFCVLTKTQFKYYRNQIDAQCWEVKPLYTCEIDAMAVIFRVNLEVPLLHSKELKSDKYNYKELNHFEIFTSDSDEVVLEEFEKFQNNEADPLDENEAKSQYQYVDLKVPQSFEIIEGRLMRKPIDSNRSKNNSISNISDLKRDSSNSLSEAEISKQQQIENHKKLWIKNRLDLTTWTGREKEWYFSEKRLLFATHEYFERERWLSLLNWILKKVSVSKETEQN